MGLGLVRVAPPTLAGRWLGSLGLLEMLPDHGFLGLVMVVLAAQRLLLPGLGIPAARELALVGRKGRRSRIGMAVPLVPAAAPLFPVMAPMVTPTGCGVPVPAIEIGGRLAVVVHRNPQDIERHEIGSGQPPGPVVPLAGIPAVVLVDPVHSIVEEVVGVRSRRVVHRVAGDGHQVGVDRLVDADAYTGKADPDAYLGGGRNGRTQQHQRHKEWVAHVHSSV